MIDAPISVAVVDDQRLLRAGLTVFLNSEPDLRVVGEAENGRTEAAPRSSTVSPSTARSETRLSGVTTRISPHASEKQGPMISDPSDNARPCRGVEAHPSGASRVVVKLLRNWLAGRTTDSRTRWAGGPPESFDQPARRSTGWPVTLAMRSKSLSKCKTVSPASSAVAATMRSGTEGARW